MDTLVIGAGMAGLTCAQTLAGDGRKVCVIDKGRGPGGRMATRRAEVGGDIVSFDHGAQYFTARDARFRQVVARWENAGVARRWPAAGENAFVGVPGMNGPIRAIAQDLDVRWNTRATGLERTDGLWRVRMEAGELTARVVLIAIPAEQAHALLADAAPDLAAIAGGVRSDPCWAVMAAFVSRLDLPDAIRADNSAIHWAARNSAKPGRHVGECWVIHASSKRSRDLLDLPKDDVGPILLDHFFAQTGIDPVAPIHLVAHRWLYAMPNPLAGAPAHYDAKMQIGIAGDYLHSARVEGAWLSGRALAEATTGV